MGRMVWLPAFVAALWTGAAASGQTPPPQAPQPQVATTVQLPTISVFTVQTTVSVPDRGGMSLGGVGRASDMGVNRAPLGSRAASSSRSASGMSVSATILDKEEMDRAVLAKAAAMRGGTASPVEAKAAAITGVMRRSEPAPMPESLAAIRQRNAAAAAERDRELANLFAKARQAEAEGKTATAKVYYQQVARRDAGQLKQQAIARLAALAASR